MEQQLASGPLPWSIRGSGSTIPVQMYTCGHVAVYAAVLSASVASPLITALSLCLSLQQTEHTLYQFNLQ